MEKPKMLHNNDFDFYVWQNSYDKSFFEINHRSGVPLKWITFGRVMLGKYKDSILKPINVYAQNLYPPPKLISIENNVIRLRQHNHAEIFMLEKNKSLYTVDRPWIRQYYQTAEYPTTPEGCFSGAHKFYSPWLIDAPVEVLFTNAGDNSPFFIHEVKGFYNKIEQSFDQSIEPKLVPFHFKKTGKHMVDEDFGKIKIGSEMFDMVFAANDIIVDKVRNFYEQD